MAVARLTARLASNLSTEYPLSSRGINYRLPMFRCEAVYVDITYVMEGSKDF